jgi:hypothetical protein
MGKVESYSQLLEFSEKVAMGKKSNLFAPSISAEERNLI